MSPLERRYRLLLRLLPARYRAVRGDELLGLLLDLDDGRTRPSVRQSSGLVALALRLRLADLPAVPAVGRALFTAYLVAYGTAGLGSLLDDYTGAFRPADLPSLHRGTPLYLTFALVEAGVAVGWILGARRAAPILQAGVTVAALGFEVNAVRVLPGYWPMALVDLAPDLLVLAVLAVAARRRWRRPGPRAPWLVAMPLAVLAWKGIGAWGRHGTYFPVLPPVVGWLTALGLAAAVAVLVRRHGWRWMSLGALAGLGAGWLLPGLLLGIAYGRYGWTVSFTAVVALLAGGAGALPRRLDPDGKASTVDSGADGRDPFPEAGT